MGVRASGLTALRSRGRCGFAFVVSRWDFVYLAEVVLLVPLL